MKKSIKNISIQFLSFIFVLLVLTFSTKVSAQQDPEKPNSSEQISEWKINDLPTLSEIIPQVSLLSDKLFILENSVDELVDADIIKEEYKKISEVLKAIATEFNALKKEENVNANEYDKLKLELDKEGQSFGKSNKALTEAIKTLETSRSEWLKYKNKWVTYQEFLLKEEIPEEAKQTLIGANKTIEKGLDIVVTKLNSLMKVQQIGYDNQSIINDLSNQILLLRQKKIVSAFEKASIPMYSSRFYAQFKGLGSKIKRGFSAVILPTESFFQNYWWIHTFQIFITVLVI